MTLARAVFFLPLLSGCAQSTYLGDPNLPVQVEIVYLGENQKPTTVHDCDTLDIVEPPQGGRMIFAGIRATNLDSVKDKIAGVLRNADGTIAGAGPDIRNTKLTPIAGRPVLLAATAEIA